jgi:ring-1,2-phenylacetyl-CoA epoxidase subunit PaaD
MISPDSIREALYDVKDPEIPTISLVDLGIVTGIEVDETNNVSVQLTPTFSGCPALKIMEELVEERIAKIEGVNTISVETNFDVQWTTDLISDEGLKAIKKHGLAPPVKLSNCSGVGGLQKLLDEMACPYCDRQNTALKNTFGPTLCRSIHYCEDCYQTFEAFKPVG